MSCKETCSAMCKGTFNRKAGGLITLNFTALYTANVSRVQVHSERRQ